MSVCHITCALNRSGGYTYMPYVQHLECFFPSGYEDTVESTVEAAEEEVVEVV